MKIAENKALTGIRGLAALCVFVGHTFETLTARGFEFNVPALLNAMLLNGGKWVDVFFVLSGFVLAMVYRDWFASRISLQSYGTFMRRRVARIYPLHFVMLLASILMVIAAHQLGVAVRTGFDTFQFSQLPYTFALVHAWGFLPGYGDWNPPSWSISIESLAYLLLPPILLATSSWTRTRPWLLIVAAVGVGVALNLWLPWENSGAGGIARGLSEFFLGCMAYGALHSRVADGFRSSIGSLLALAIMMTTFALFKPTGFHIAVATVPVLWALTGSNPVSRAFAWRPMYFLGEISYSIYLGHFVFSTVAYRIIDMEWMRSGTLPTILGLCFIVGFVVALSTCTYHLIERRSRELLDGRRDRPRKLATQLSGAKD